MAQQLTVKAYLKRWNVERKQLEAVDEIRRFSVDQDVATSYAYLLAKVTAVFPGLNNKAITLYWRDVDNDMIAFSSDDELLEAVKNVSDGMLRVYIHEKPSTAPSSAPEPLHVGVTCDGCEGEVRGVRYKCLNCPDYDLCSGCKVTGMHSEHEMAAMEHPLHMFHGAFVGNMRGFPPCVPPPPPPPSSAPHGFEAGCCDPADVRRMNRRAWKRWYKETYGDDHKCKLKKERKDQEKQEKKRKKEAKKAEKVEKGKDSSTEKKSSDSSSSAESDTGDQSPGTEYLRNVGHSVAAMLDPLGIDVEVDVECHGNRRRCRRGPMRGGPWFHGMRGGWCGPWGMRGGVRGGFGFGHGTPPCRRGPRAAAATADQQPQPMDNSDAAQENRRPNAETGEMASGPNEATAASVLVTDHGWTLVNDGMADVEGATTGVEQLHVAADPPAADNHTDDPAAPAADGTIETAVEQMMSMGYSNDGGWLTHLLIAHQGDIGRALDAIHANK